MTLSFWRYSHLALAVFSSLFLVMASLTGIILAVDAIQEKTPSYRVENFSEITLEQILPGLKKVYPEITELSVDHNQFVTLQGIDQEGDDFNSYIDPRTGKVLGQPIKKSEFIQWTTALHRSLFLKETGRFFVGLISFILALIAISGLVLVVKRQQGFRNFFSKIVKEQAVQYYHVVLGRWSLIPILIIALTGAYLSLERFNFFCEQNSTTEKTAVTIKQTSQNTAASAFKTILLADVQKIEFPFSDDPEEYFIIKLNDREIEVDQVTGTKVSETLFPSTTVLSSLSLDLHTGRSNAIWAFVLAVATANILYFIYSGFAMTLQRRASRIKNKYNAAESKFILLTGSENGSTLRFANAIHKQLLAQGYKAFIAELNNFEQYPQAEHLIVFTSTHGLGDPPSNAVKFTDQLSKNPQKQNIKTTVVGFGSYAYPDFCAYAKEIDQLLAAQSWTTPFLEMQTVNDKSAQEFVSWVKLWSEKTGIALSTTPSLYNHVPGGLKKMKVLNKTIVSDTDQTFLLTLRPPVTVPFTSGDLLAIYPDNDTKERLYSIAKSKENIQLVVKLHPHGLGSGYLYNAKPGNVIKARIMNNNGFHFPKKPTAVAMISNGTGIAPFLGMIEQNKKQSEIHLYCGFRQTTETIAGYRKFANEMMEKNQLKNFQVAFSREEQHYYVMDLIKQDAEFFADLLTRGGTVMICGSLAMQRDVEAVLTSILLSHGPKEFSVYKNNGQILTDCY